MKRILIIILISFISGCQNTNVSRHSFIVPDQKISSMNWEQILIDSPKSIDIFKILHTGSVKVPLGGMLNLDKMPENHGLDEDIWVDVFAFLFHHSDKGWFLIDTGLDASYQGKGNIHGLVSKNYIKEHKQNTNQNIGALLKKENKKIKGIFLTHMHGDHTSGLPEIDGNIPIYTGKEERNIHIPLLYYNNHFMSPRIIYDIDIKNGLPIAPLSSVIDIFGDMSLIAIFTPGHSDSHISFLLLTKDGPILLTGDASHTKYGFENNIEPGWVDSKEMAADSLNQLIKLKELFPQIKVIWGHQLE